MPFFVIPERQKLTCLFEAKKRQLAKVKSEEQVSRQSIGDGGDDDFLFAPCYRLNLRVHVRRGLDPFAMSNSIRCYVFLIKPLAIISQRPARRFEAKRFTSDSLLPFVRGR